ncbi:MAG: cell envelope integrity protein TolA [Desulfobulbaceae bacterium]|nr:cell envelope integrity protein TolA [Desulfobulbaceae bacterium]
MLVLNGMSFSDTDFYLQQKEFDRFWHKPVALALAFHFLIFALSYYLPEMLDRKPILDEIVTVNLVSMPDIQAPAPVQETPPPRAPEEKPPEIPKPEPAKAEVQIAEIPVTVPEKAEPVKPVSLQPLKRKVQKTDPEKIAREEARKQRERERQQALARARQEEEQARLAAEEARAALAAMIRQKDVQPQSTRTGRSSGGREVNSIVIKNYLAALHGQVQRYWVLPDMKQWDSKLETVVILYIRRDGSVNTVIEKKSKDPLYDQFVMKTIDNARPLPQLPKMITQEPLEVGLVFRPGELLM